MALLSRALLAKALLDKTTRQYADKPTWGSYSYDKDIYPQARLAFPEYDKLYRTNEDFTKYFVRDLNNKNPKLLQKLSAGAVTKEDQALIDRFNQTIIAEQMAAESQLAKATPTQTPVGTTAGDATGGIGLPSAPSITLPRVFVARQAPPPSGGMEGGTGQGSAATAKIDRMRVEATKGTASVPQEKTPSSTPAAQRLNIQGFKLPSSFVNTAKNFGSNTQIFARKNLGRVFDSLKGIAGGLGRGVAGPGITGLYNLGGRLGNGTLNAVGRISRPGGLGRGGVGNLSKSSNRLALGFIGLLIFMVLLGGIFGGIGGTTPSGEAAPLPGTADIASCKFTRGAETPPDAGFKSSALLGYIQEASQKANIPPVVLAAFIRVESPASSNMSNDEIANYAKNCAESPTGALGIMQIQPPGTKSLRGDPASCDDCIDAGAKLVGKTVSTLTRQDYCDPRTSIIVGAGWILKKMSNLGLGDGTKWDPAWTNDRTAIKTLVNTYYGCLNYGGADPNDCTGPYNYADDVSTSIQNCKTSTVPPPPADGNYKKWVLDFGIDIKDGFTPDVYRWAHEVLASTTTVAPKFQGLIGTGTTVVSTCEISHTDGKIIYLRNNTTACPDSVVSGPTANEDYFKQVFIHEIGHVINGSYSPGKYGDRIKNAIRSDGYLTAYSRNAAVSKKEICGYGDEDIRANEDFAESISYFVNINIKERDYGCGTDDASQNPIYKQQYAGGYWHQAHYQLMNELLK